MPGWFSRLAGAASPPPPAQQAPPAAAAAAAERRASDDAEASKLLDQATQALNQLRVASGAPDFPLLNKATRQVQALDAFVAGLRDGDTKAVWRRCVRRILLLRCSAPARSGSVTRTVAPALLNRAPLPAPGVFLQPSGGAAARAAVCHQPHAQRVADASCSAGQPTRRAGCSAGASSNISSNSGTNTTPSGRLGGGR